MVFEGFRSSPKDAKAVQVGGASGACVPRSEFHRKIAFEDIPTGGSIIVFGPERDMLAVAKNFLEFFVEESCGQCTPCRVGTAKAARLMEAPKWDAGLLEELSQAMADASICGLGQAAPNPIRCVIKHFPHEV